MSTLKVRSACSVTLPINVLRKPDRPCVPITSRSARSDETARDMDIRRLAFFDPHRPWAAVEAAGGQKGHQLAQSPLAFALNETATYSANAVAGNPLHRKFGLAVKRSEGT